MKRIIAIFIAAVMLTALISGCGNQEQKETIEQSTASTSTVQTTEAFPLTVTDANGFNMTIDKKPVKIASLALGTDEILLSLVDKSRIIALTNLSTDVGLSNVVDIAKDFPNKIKGEAEKVISLQPDLVFVASWADKGLVQQLRDAKISVYAFAVPNNIEEQKKMVLDIARLVGEDEKGNELVSQMDSKLKEIEDKLKTLKPEQKLTALGCDSFLYAYGKNTTFDDIVTKAGLINAASVAGMEGWKQISKEKIIELNPDVIFLPAWSYEGFDAKSFADGFKKDKSLQGVKAIKNNMVLMIPEAHMTTNSQYIVLGVEDTAKSAYPDIFK